MEGVGIQSEFFENCTGCTKKTSVLGFLDITPLRKGLGTKEGCVLKKSGNFLYDTYQNFQFDQLEVEKFGSKDGNPT